MTESPKKPVSQNIWDAHEWETASSAHRDGLDSQNAAEDIWEDGAEWPPETPTGIQTAAQTQTTPVDTKTEDSSATETAAAEPKPAEPADAKEAAEREPSEPAEAVETSESAEALESAEASEDKVVTPDQAEEAPARDEAFALDSVRNDDAWGESDVAWKDSEWNVPQEEDVKDADAAEEAEVKVTQQTEETAASEQQATEPAVVSLPSPGWVASFEGWRGYLLVFVFALLIFSILFGKRIGQVSSDPHYVLLADSFLKNRWFLDQAPTHPITGARMTNDWAQMDVIRVTRVNGKSLSKVTELRGWWRGRRGNRRVFSTLDKNYVVQLGDVRAQRRFYFVSFPPLPAYLMMGPMWLLGKLGYDRQRFSDITFSLFFAALSVLLLFWLLQRLSQSGRSPRTLYENLQLTALYAFGSVFFFVAVQGTVWYTALVIGTCCSFAFLIAAQDSKHPFLAGLFVALGFLTRPLLVFLSLFFLWQVIRKREGWESPLRVDNLRKLVIFALPVALTILGMMMFNHHRFGNPLEFGHAYLPAVFGRVEKYGLFHWHWVPRNFFAFFLATPEFAWIGKAIKTRQMVGGVGLLSGKVSVLNFVQVWSVLLVGLLGYLVYRHRAVREQENQADVAFWTAGFLLIAAAVVPLALRWVPFPKINAHGLSLFITTPGLLFLFVPMFNKSKNRDPWFWGLIGTSAVIIAMLLFYQNTGWLTFGQRFSLDYMPLLLVALATSGVVLGRLWKLLLVVAVVINTFGAISFGRAWGLYHHDFHSLQWIYSIDWIKHLFS